MRKRLFFWTPLAILVILYYFGGKFGFFPGAGDSPSSSDNASVPAENAIQVDASGHAGNAGLVDSKSTTGDSNDKALDQTNPLAKSESATDSSSKAIPTKSLALHLLIDDRELFITGPPRTGDDSPNWLPISLADVVSQAGRLRDNSEFRVVISRKGSSRVRTEQELHDALRQVGIAEDQIQVEERLTP